MKYTPLLLLCSCAALKGAAEDAEPVVEHVVENPEVLIPVVTDTITAAEGAGWVGGISAAAFGLYKLWTTIRRKINNKPA